MSMLHTINKSPFERNSCETCLRLAEAGSSILFIEDGVYGALKGTACTDTLTAKAKDFKLYVLAPDLNARGLSQDDLVEGIQAIDYGGFVDLASSHERVQAWL